MATQDRRQPSTKLSCGTATSEIPTLISVARTLCPLGGDDAFSDLRPSSPRFGRRIVWSPRPFTEWSKGDKVSGASTWRGRHCPSPSFLPPPERLRTLPTVRCLIRHWVVNSDVLPRWKPARRMLVVKQIWGDVGTFRLHTRMRQVRQHALSSPTVAVNAMICKVPCLLTDVTGTSLIGPPD